MEKTQFISLEKSLVTFVIETFVIEEQVCLFLDALASLRAMIEIGWVGYSHF